MSITTSIYDAARTTLALIKTYLGTDEKENEEPVHNEDTNIDAADWNTIVAGLAEVAKRTRPGNLAVYPFNQANCTDSQAAVALARDSAGDAARTAATAWRDGSVVGLAIWSEGARTAGTCTVVWTKNGIAQTLSVALNATTTQMNRAYQLPAVEEFSALDTLGVKVTTDGTWAAGVTPSISVDLIVSYGEEEDI